MDRRGQNLKKMVGENKLKSSNEMKTVMNGRVWVGEKDNGEQVTTGGQQRRAWVGTLKTGV